MIRLVHGLGVGILSNIGPTVGYRILSREISMKLGVSPHTWFNT